jgi:hypothetical protein
MSSALSIVDESSSARVACSRGGTMTDDARELTLAVERVVRLLAEPRPMAASPPVRPRQPAKPRRGFREPLLPIADAGRANRTSPAPQLRTYPERGERGADHKVQQSTTSRRCIMSEVIQHSIRTDPFAAQRWSKCTEEEMLRDRLLLKDLKNLGSAKRPSEDHSTDPARAISASLAPRSADGMSLR